MLFTTMEYSMHLQVFEMIPQAKVSCGKNQRGRFLERTKLAKLATDFEFRGRGLLVGGVVEGRKQNGWRQILRRTDDNVDSGSRF
jgi:hypothetical protein